MSSATVNALAMMESRVIVLERELDEMRRRVAALETICAADAADELQGKLSPAEVVRALINRKEL